MSKKLRTEAVDHLFDAILCLKDREECYTFFEDVCTVNELLSLSQRFEVAKMLRDQKHIWTLRRRPELRRLRSVVSIDLLIMVTTDMIWSFIDWKDKSHPNHKNKTHNKKDFPFLENPFVLFFF